MKGKVFESSRDVYQDQAQVLFDFYLNAAQKIIDQEDDFDKKSEELDGEIASINESANHVGRDYVIGGALLVIGLVLLIVNPIIGAIVAIAGCAYLFKTYNFKKNIQSNIDEIEQKKQEAENEQIRLETMKTKLDEDEANQMEKLKSMGIHSYEDLDIEINKLETEINSEIVKYA